MSLICDYKWMPTTFQDVSVFGFYSSPSFITLDRQTFRSLFHFAKKNNKKIFLPLKTSSLPVLSQHHIYMFLPFCIIFFVFLYFGLLQRKRVSRRQRERDRWNTKLTKQTINDRRRKIQGNRETNDNSLITLADFRFFVFLRISVTNSWLRSDFSIIL